MIWQNWLAFPIDRIADILEALIKVAGGVLIIGGAMKRWWVPWRDRVRREQDEAEGKRVRELLKPELERVRLLCEREETCIERLEAFALNHAADMAAREEEAKEADGEFEELLDDLIATVVSNRDWMIETHGLLSSLGLSGGRRRPEGESDGARKKELPVTLERRMAERRRKRRLGLLGLEPDEEEDKQ